MTEQMRPRAPSVGPPPIEITRRPWEFVLSRPFALQAAALGSILVLAFAVRMIALTALGFNSDEAVYAGQAAAIAQDPALSRLFPIFRAHPLLYQFFLALAFQLGITDWTARFVSVLVGLLTVYLTYALGRTLYGRRAGLLAALLIALMPYHVIVSRQVLLDGPMTLFSTLTLLLLATYAVTRRPLWLYAAGAGMGLTFLSKETGVLLVGAIYVFFALSPKVPVRIRDLVLATACMVLVMLPFPLTLALAGGGGAERTQQYAIWQFFRRPNHDWHFYLTTVPLVIGPLVLLAAALGFWALRRARSWRETLLAAWIVVPVLFFQLWPTKGFQYLLPIATPVAVLAGRTLGLWGADGSHRSQGRRLAQRAARFGAVGVVALSLLVPTLQRVLPSATTSFLAGSGGVPGGREAALWVGEHAPEGATLMTIGPSMANILQFYGHRRALGLSVSPNPLHRNPAYTPIRNPDFEIRTGEIQYLVWDAYSAGRSSFFSDKILAYASRYNGRVAHVETVEVPGPAGEPIAQPVIVIYEVRP